MSNNPNLNRWGKFRVSNAIYKSEDICRVFGLLRLAPYRTEFMWGPEEFEVYGMSPMFDEVEPGAITPEYTIHIHIDEHGAVESVKVDKVST